MVGTTSLTKGMVGVVVDNPSPPDAHRVVAITGAGGRVAGRLAADPGTVIVELDLASPDLKTDLEGADTLVHLAFARDPLHDEAALARLNLDATKRLLDAAGAVGVRHVVCVSSAMVYGAWPGSPVPLTEDAPVRPNPGLAYAVQK